MNEANVMKRLLQLAGVVLLTLFCIFMCTPPEERPFLQEELKDYKINYGLDLKGGSELLYEVDPKDIDPTQSAERVIENTSEIIRQRIQASGIVREPRVQKQGSDRLLIQLPGLNKEDTNKIKEEIQRLGKLEFRLVASPDVWEGIEESTERETYKRKKKIGGEVLENYQERLQEKGYAWFEERDTNQERLLWIKDPYNINGQKFANFYYDNLSQNIKFELKDSAASEFADLTTKYQKELFAIVYNNKVVATPVINGPIPGGRGVLQGFSREEFKGLLTMLRSGSLEIRPELLHENTIGPSLGEDSIRLGISAGIIGLICVLVFMMFYYFGAGLIAVIALLLNLLIVFTILVIVRETLTLPGIAGLILTVGMSIDANIIIFERIREERDLRRQETEKGGEKSNFQKQELLGFVGRGYQQAFSTIIDANVTTLITAGILYMIATGAVQGFAFIMWWGVIASFFTAIFITRLLLSLCIEGGLIRNLSMLELVKSPNLNLTGNMRVGAIGSIIVVLTGLAVFFVRGEQNYGLDLKGGVLAQISLEEPLSTDEVRSRLAAEDVAKMFSESPEVQHIVSRYKEGGTDQGWYEFSIRLPNQNEEEIAAIDDQLDELSKEMRKKRFFLQDVESRMIRIEQERKRVIREIRQAKKEDRSESYIDALRQERDTYQARLDDVQEELDAIMKEVETLQKKRSDLVAKKNSLSGVDTLRNVVYQKFQKELSPPPFGQVSEIDKGKLRGYYRLPVVLQSPVPREKLTSTLKEIEGFDKVLIAVKEYELTFEAAEDLQNPKEEVPQQMKKHLELARPSLSPNPIENIEEKNGKWHVLFSFPEAAPFQTVKDAMEKCDFASYTLRVAGIKGQDLPEDKEYLTRFDALVSPPTHMLGKSLGEVSQFMHVKIRDKFSNTEYQYKGESSNIYLSEPFPRFTQISGVVARAQKKTAYRAILLALLAILIYIGYRFPNGWRFGFAAVVALAHDIAITLGCIAIFGHLGLVDVKIGLPVIAALLTIVGYSLNDTIVIFDRIRENQAKYEVWERLSITKVTEVFNQSMNQTLSRTVLTSLTTFLVVGVIFVLNKGRGSVMEGFSFALMVGIIVGTYSSIFVASNTVLKLEERQRGKA